MSHITGEGPGGTSGAHKYPGAGSLDKYDHLGSQRLALWLYMSVGAVVGACV